MSKHDYDFFYKKFIKSLRILKKLKLYNVPHVKGLLFSFYSSKANKDVEKNKIIYAQNDISDVVVSLTSYGERVEKVWMTISTLLEQTILPKKIVLYLGNTNQNSIDLPEKLKMYVADEKLEIRFRNDLGPHTKYFYAIQEFPENDIVICDDDVFYPKDWLETLILMRNENPNCICCNLAHEITLNDEHNINDYSKWNYLTNKTGPLFSLCALGTGGVLYPKKCLNEVFLNQDLISKLCLKNDDLWLKVASILSGIKTVKSTNYPYPFLEIKGSSRTALSNVNNGLNRNDVILADILKLHGKEVIEVIEKENI